MASTEQIKHLKLVIGAVDVTVPREAWSAPNLADGVPKGCIVELLGPQKYEWFISFLKTNPELCCFWAEKDQQVLPTSLSQRGLKLENITFALLGNDAFVPLRKVIQSQVYPVVLATQQFKELKMLRAFQLLTEKSNSTLFLINNQQASDAWPIGLQLDIKRSSSGDGFEIEILKQKFRRPE